MLSTGTKKSQETGVLYAFHSSRNLSLFKTPQGTLVKVPCIFFSNNDKPSTAWREAKRTRRRLWQGITSPNDACRTGYITNVAANCATGPSVTTTLISNRKEISVSKSSENTQVAIKHNLNFCFHVLLYSTLTGDVVNVTSKIYRATSSCETLLKFISLDA